jgi:CubicO group peptidase (beta-lactamase class C family)
MFPAVLLLALAPSVRCETIEAVHEAIVPFLESHDVAGVVTMIATPKGVKHLDAQGWANIEHHTPIKEDSIFWIASMTKPIAATAVLMLMEEEKISLDDPAAKFVPELGQMKNADGSASKTTITIKHLLTHTAGLPELTPEENRNANELQDIVAAFSSKPMQFEPGTKWLYSQTAINSLGRIVEVLSGKRFDAFLEERITGPLGMKDTTFYPSPQQQKRIASSYKKENDKLVETEIHLFVGRDLGDRKRVPLANGGLFSTAPDFARFAQMLLNGGSFDGKRYLKAETVKLMTQIQTGDLATGFTPGNGWGLGVCVIKNPQGVTSSLSTGSFGHGGAYGTQVWIDPVKKLAYILMVQRANFPNSDASDLRKAFQDAAQLKSPEK